MVKFSIKRAVVCPGSELPDSTTNNYVTIELTPDELEAAYEAQKKLLLLEEAERQLRKVLDRDLGYSPDVAGVMFPDDVLKERFLDGVATLFQVRTQDPAYTHTPEADGDIWRDALLEAIDILLVPCYVGYLAKQGVKGPFSRSDTLWEMAERHWFAGNQGAKKEGQKEDDPSPSLREAAEEAYKNFLRDGGFSGKVEELFPDAEVREKLFKLSPSQFGTVMLSDKEREKFFDAAIENFKRPGRLPDQPTATEVADNWRWAIAVAHNQVLRPVYIRRLQNHGVKKEDIPDSYTTTATEKVMKMLAAHGWLWRPALN